MDSDQIVSVVIPSRNRPRLVGRAVRSALEQTLTAIEVIVVVDGPDDLTEKALAGTADPRLKVVVLPASVGAGAARNAGVRAAAGRFVAFLDDDDEWLPEKLERQLAAARASACTAPIVACRLLLRSTEGDEVRPERLPQPSEPIAEYLCRRRFRVTGDPLIQTSTFFTTKDLLTRTPWRTCPHDDMDWLLRASASDDVCVEFLPDVLAIWHNDQGPARLSSTGQWRVTLEWFRSLRHLVSPRTYASFLLNSVSQWARIQGDRAAFRVLLREAVRSGDASVLDCVAHTMRWILPTALRRSLKAGITPRPSTPNR